MLTGGDCLLKELRQLISEDGSKLEKLQRAATLMRNSGTYRWVGLYEVDRQANEVLSLVWDGPGAPKYPRFPISKGLTGVAIKELKVVNVGDVASDSRYLTAFGSTRSEIIVPIFDEGRDEVVGTIDVESERPNAFDEKSESLLVMCAEVVAQLWCNG